MIKVMGIEYRFKDFEIEKKILIRGDIILSKDFI